MTERRISRRSAIAAGAALVAGLAGCDGDGDGTVGTATPTDASTATETDAASTATGTASDPQQSDVAVTASELGVGFTSPVGVETVGDGRYYVVDQPGTVEVIEDGGVRPDPFLDLGDRVVDVSGYTEMGLLGLAFHPNYAVNGRIFVRYSAPKRSGTPENYSHTFVVAEFQADPAAGTVDVASETAILELPQPQGNHNAGALAFGPDGYLYVATGDGGRAADQGTGHADDWYDAVAGGNGQDLTANLLGSMLRIDVDGSATVRGEQRNYAIPDDNPLVDGDGFAELYAWGFRNPWRFSFGPDGRLFAGDVGQNRYEEVDIVEKGGNYGWNVREGTHCFRADSCPAETPDGDPLIDPIIEYSHSGEGITGVTVIGGYRYGGDEIPDLQGKYVFADWRAGGTLFVATESNDGQWPVQPLPVQGEFGSNVLSFGRTSEGELLVCTTEKGVAEGRTGAVYRLESA